MAMRINLTIINGGKMKKTYLAVFAVLLMVTVLFSSCDVHVGGTKLEKDDIATYLAENIVGLLESWGVLPSDNSEVKMYVKKAVDENYEKSDELVFNSPWEPGGMQLGYVKVVNDGSLAAEYSFCFSTIVEGEYVAPNLGDVIEVYACAPDTVVTRDMLYQGSAFYMGKLSEINYLGGSVVLPGESVEFCLILKMSESAGNEYQSLADEDICFCIEITQYEAEISN